MKILFVFTGGTIGSTEKGGLISADASKAYKIIEFYSKNYGIDFEYDVAEPYTELSENNTGDNIRLLCESVAANVGKGYDGIIVTHGTDTLQYSAAALGYTLGLSEIPVCIVSANRPIEHKKSNALDNLHGAMSLIRAGGQKGVFVIYRNDNSTIVRIHRATRLVGVKAFSDDVSSIKNGAYGYFDKNFKLVKSRKYKESEDMISPFSPTSLKPLNDKTLFITPYVGMRYPIISDGVEGIVFNTYHSGTLDTKSVEARRFFESAKKKGVAVYAVGIGTEATYESTSLFDELGIIPLRDIAPIAAYVKLWLALSLDIDADDVLSKSLSGDIVCK